MKKVLKAIFAKFIELKQIFPASKEKIRKKTDISSGKSLNIWSKQSILFKMSFAFLLLIVIPVTVIGYISTATASNSLITKAEQSVNQSSLQTVSYIDLLLEKAEDTSIQIISNSTVQKFAKSVLSTTNNSTNLFNDQKDASSYVSSLHSVNSILGDIQVILKTGDSLGLVQKQSDMNPILNAEWYKKAQSAKGKPVWIDNHTETGKGYSTLPYSVSLVRLLMSQEGFKEMGIVLVDVRVDAFDKILSSVNLGMKDKTFLITDGGKIFGTKSDNANQNTRQDEFVRKAIEESANSGKDLLYMKDSGETYLVAVHCSETKGYKVLTIIPRNEIVSGASSIRSRTILVGILFALIAVLVGLALTYAMTKDMKRINDAMTNVGKGNLAIKFETNRTDELGKLAEGFNEMLSEIKVLVQNSRDTSTYMEASSSKVAHLSKDFSRTFGEIVKTIEEVAIGASKQAIEAESCVKSVANLADKLDSAAESTKTMRLASEEVKSFTSHGLSMMEKLNNQSTETNAITNSVVTEIGQLNEYAKNINSVTVILKKIADQTNLLSLNAAIEAARAGDAGKGFAVVADEIRKLADQSNSFTKDIQDMVAKIQKQTEYSTELVSRADTSIRGQAALIRKSTEVFSEIEESTEKLSVNVDRIADMTNEMDSYKESLMINIEQMSAVSQQTAASSEEVSASSEEQLQSIQDLDTAANKLNELAQSLVNTIRKFSL